MIHRAEINTQHHAFLPRAEAVLQRRRSRHRHRAASADHAQAIINVDVVDEQALIKPARVLPKCQFDQRTRSHHHGDFIQRILDPAPMIATRPVGMGSHPAIRAPARATFLDARADHRGNG